MSNQALHVEQQGQTQKFVLNVSNIDFNADYAKSLQQEIYYVTERAVFQLTRDGLMLIEVAPGLDIERDVIAQMGFRPLVSKNLKTIDTSIYHHVWGGTFRSHTDRSMTIKNETRGYIYEFRLDQNTRRF
nr:hypothetical protein [Staphylococcus coagulans]